MFKAYLNKQKNKYEDNICLKLALKSTGKTTKITRLKSSMNKDFYSRYLNVGLADSVDEKQRHFSQTEKKNNQLL